LSGERSGRGLSGKAVFMKCVEGWEREDGRGRMGEGGWNEVMRETLIGHLITEQAVALCNRKCLSGPRNINLGHGRFHSRLSEQIGRSTQPILQHSICIEN
jgi:hypothetical protein